MLSPCLQLLSNQQGLSHNWTFPSWKAFCQKQKRLVKPQEQKCPVSARIAWKWSAVMHRVRASSLVLSVQFWFLWNCWYCIPAKLHKVHDECFNNLLNAFSPDFLMNSRLCCSECGCFAAYEFILYQSWKWTSALVISVSASDKKRPRGRSWVTERQMTSSKCCDRTRKTFAYSHKVT